MQLNQDNKNRVWDFWQALESANSDQFSVVAGQFMAPGLVWHGPDPINELNSPASFVADFWAPLLESFPDLQRETHIFMAGQSNGLLYTTDPAEELYWCGPGGRRILEVVGRRPLAAGGRGELGEATSCSANSRTSRDL